MADIPRVSFGMIVLNGEPFVRYNLRALYPFAHEIIVVEGAVPGAAAIATPDGHSRDGTLDTLYRFKAQEDPENKLQIVTRDGFWSEKDEMSQAFAERATGDYLWQIDVDEFYMPEAMRTVLDMLHDDSAVTAVSFHTLTFWGSLDYRVDGWYLRRGAGVFHRLFKWGPGYRYVSHRPPTVCTPRGQDTRRVKWVRGIEMARRGVVLYHYALLFPKQALDKGEYYRNAVWAKMHGARAWADCCYLRLENPFRVHNAYFSPSWLERFVGKHPPQIEHMWSDIVHGRVDVTLRQTDDVEVLLRTLNYRWQRWLLKLAERVDWGIRIYPLQVLKKGWRLVHGKPG